MDLEFFEKLGLFYAYPLGVSPMLIKLCIIRM